MSSKLVRSEHVAPGPTEVVLLALAGSEEGTDRREGHWALFRSLYVEENCV